jgi:hypothetical protein
MLAVAVAVVTVLATVLPVVLVVMHCILTLVSQAVLLRSISTVVGYTVVAVAVAVAVVEQFAPVVPKPSHVHSQLAVPVAPVKVGRLVRVRVPLVTLQTVAPVPVVGVVVGVVLVTPVLLERKVLDVSTAMAAVAAVVRLVMHTLAGVT